MENYNQPIFENSGLSDTAKYYLLDTVRWTKFIGIMSMIGLGLMVFAAFMIMAGGAFMSQFNSIPGFSGVMLGLVYLILCGLYFYPTWCLLKFSSNIKNGIATNSNDMINEGFRYQKNMYKFMGIFLIIIIAFYLLIFIFAAIAGIANR